MSQVYYKISQWKLEHGVALHVNLLKNNDKSTIVVLSQQMPAPNGQVWKCTFQHSMLNIKGSAPSRRSSGFEAKAEPLHQPARMDNFT